MKRYGNIYEKIASVENLKEAHRMARADGVVLIHTPDG